MTQEGFVTDLQRQKRYDWIPLDPEAPGLLFRTTSATHIHLQDRSRVHPNQHFGNLLKEYIQLLIQTLDKQTQKVDNSVFPLPLPTPTLCIDWEKASNNSTIRLKSNIPY